MPLPSLRNRALAFVVGCAALTGCHVGATEPVYVVGSTSRTIPVHVGADLTIELGTVGPGEYASPPDISSPAVLFVDMQYDAPVPSGVGQRFRFRAVATGTAILVFHNSGYGRTVQDTVRVD